MADKDDVASCLMCSLGLAVHFRHQRAGRVDIVEPACFGLGGHCLGHAVRAEHDRDAVGDLVERFDENRSLGLQRFNDVAVVHDFVTDIDRRPIAQQRQLDDADRAVDAGAKAARRRDQDVEDRAFAALRAHYIVGSVHGPRALAQHNYRGKAASSVLRLVHRTDKKRRAWKGEQLFDAFARVWKVRFL